MNKKGKLSLEYFLAPCYSFPFVYVMKSIHRFLALFLVSLVAFLATIGLGFAQNNYYHLPDKLSPDADVSILIASPSSNAVYTVYGHAGLRVKDKQSSVDITFNYGIFDFTDDFLVKFISGQTDYLVVPIVSSYYIKEYLDRGSQITEVNLNLNERAKAYLWSYLVNNIDPKNRVYRYNFFYDNCSIRLLNVVKKAVSEGSVSGTFLDNNLELDTLALSKQLACGTWREEINKLEAPLPWLVLGTDLALGSQTDKHCTYEELCFLPKYLPIVLQYYSIRSVGADEYELFQPLVSSIKTIGISAMPKDNIFAQALSPSILFLILFLIIVYKVQGFIFKKKTIAKGYDIVLFALTGVAGLILCYLSFLSEHPHTFPNYNIWVMNPLNLLIAVPFLSIKGLNNWAYRYHFANFVSQVAFLLVAYFLPQHFNTAIYYISLALAILSLARIIEQQKKKEDVLSS